MKTSHFKNSMFALATIATLSMGSCKNNNAESENAPPVVTTEGDTVHIDTANVPLDTGKATKPILRTNSEDGTNSGL